MVCRSFNLSHGFPILYVVERLLDRSLSERVRGRALESSLLVFILRFPGVKNWLMYGHVRTMRNVPQECYHNSFVIFPIARTCTCPYINNYIMCPQCCTL